MRNGAALLSTISALACALCVAAPAGAAELVTIPSKGPGPDEFDQVYVNKIGPDDAKQVLVLMPGTSGGAGDFTLVARDLVKRVPDLAVWAIDRRSQALEDRRGLSAAQGGRGDAPGSVRPLPGLDNQRRPARGPLHVPARWPVSVRP